MNELTDPRLAAFAAELRKWWSFDNGQIHTHSWHTREDFIEGKLPELLAAQRLEAREVSEAKVERAVKASCQTERGICFFPNCLCADNAGKLMRAALEAVKEGS